MNKDILFTILQWCDTRALINLSMCSNITQEIISDSYFWIIYYQAHNFKWIKYQCKKDWIKSLIVMEQVSNYCNMLDKLDKYGYSKSSLIVHDIRGRIDICGRDDLTYQAWCIKPGVISMIVTKHEAQQLLYNTCYDGRKIEICGK